MAEEPPKDVPETAEAEETAKEPETEEEEDEPEIFTLEILKLIKETQQQHGLRHGDYQRYRGYCSRRIRRLRVVLSIPQGDKRHFKRRDVTQAHLVSRRAEERLLHIPLVLAERNWAYAMQLRQEANTEPRKRFHLVQKLRKACLYALQLEEICKSDKCDARSKLESQAYVAWLHGTLHFELQLWAKAMENLKRAQVIYEKLASTLPEEEQQPYKQRVDEIGPSLRYCAYNIGDEKEVDLLELRSQGVVENVESLISQSKEKGATVLHEVEWFGEKVPIRLERARLFLLSIEGLDDSLKHAEDLQAKITILENMFIDLRDVVGYVRDEAKNNDSRDIQLLLAYLISIRVERTIQRNLFLIQQTKKPQDRVRLFDIIIQQLTELSQTDVLKGNEHAQKSYDAQLKAYRALRRFYMAKTHAAFRRWKEAAAFFDNVKELVGEFKGEKFGGELEVSLVNLEVNAEAEAASAKAHFVLEQEEDSGAVPERQKSHKNKKPLIERLDEFGDDAQVGSKNPNIVTVPPNMEPVPAKPLFYDLALNFVKMPSLDDKIEEGKGQRQAGGISGLVKGLWGWGKK